MNKIIVDFETKSPVNITKAGSHKYIRHPKADIIFMGYKVNDEPTKIWYPALDSLPKFMRNIPTFADVVFYAFNVEFDYEVWNILGTKYSFPHVPLENWIDVQALCGRYTFPQNLKQASKVVGKGNIIKDPAGKKLIKAITQPPFIYSQRQYNQFRNYCLQDVRATYNILKHLPTNKLHKKEQKIWELTKHINSRGLPVDTKAIQRIYNATQEYLRYKLEEIEEASEGYITSINQIARIVEFCRLRGLNIKNCQAATINSVFVEYENGNINLDEDVKNLLKLRQALGKNSVAKYGSLLERTYNDRIYGNLRYYGTGTGRWSGMGFQAQNLPRASVEDAEEEIEKFMSGDIVDEDPIQSAKALIRSMIKAPKGKRIIAADYSGIENRVLFWLTGEEDILDKIREGLDVYKLVASQMFQIPYEDITSDMRQRGKTVVLGAGFGLGEGGYIEYAKGFGITVDEYEAHGIISGFRNRFPRIPQYWYGNLDAAIRAISMPRTYFTYRHCVYSVHPDNTSRKWLILKLPSGRSLFYCEPKLIKNDFGRWSIEHKGINPYTRQWGRKFLPPSRLTENIVQATARDIMADHMLKLDKYGFNIILTVHDEIICEEDKEKSKEKLEHMIEIMCSNPEWAKGLPLGAEGMIMKRYRKM